MKILIADDNPDSRLVLKKMLEAVGHTVESAVHGEEALAKARRAVRWSSKNGQFFKQLFQKAAFPRIALD